MKGLILGIEVVIIFLGFWLSDFIPDLNFGGNRDHFPTKKQEIIGKIMFWGGIIALFISIFF